MEWRKFPQKEDDFHRIPFNGEIYNQHMVFLVSFRQSFFDFYPKNETHQFRCLNMNTNSWKIFNIKKPDLFHIFKKVIVYKDSLWLVQESREGGTCLQKYNLKNLDLEDPLSPEEQRLKAFFMNQSDSDIKFQVQDKIIPAHKEVLTKRSRFFAGLFNSGMAETKQDVIEIKDCDFALFQEFLRYLYCGEINIGDIRFAFDLLEFADKHLQEDLVKKCFHCLASNINSKTVFPLFEEAHAKNLQNLIISCADYLKTNITLDKISEIIQFLIPKQNEYPPDLRDKVLEWIMENYFEIYRQEQTERLRLCEEFLIKSIERETIVRISQFIAQENDRKHFIRNYTDSIRLNFQKQQMKWDRKNEKDVQKEARQILKQETVNLRSKVYSWMRENWNEMNQEEIEKDLPKKLLMSFISFIVKTPNPNEKNEVAKNSE